MSSPNSYREIKLVHGELINRIKNLDSDDWAKVCLKLGLYVSKSSGKGSHCAVYKDNVCSPADVSCLVVTIPNNIYPNFQRDLVKKVLFYGIKSEKYSEEDFWKVLGLM